MKLRTISKKRGTLIQHKGKPVSNGELALILYQSIYQIFKYTNHMAALRKRQKYI